ncbi:ABC transporter permease [Natrialbaceae archaeon A-CW1-1]
MLRSKLRSWLTRWRGLIAVACRQTVSRATYTARQRVLFSILGVAVAISLLVVVTAIGVGLATSTTVYDDDVDYWIVPESDGGSSPLIATDRPAFGGAHETAAELEHHPEIEYVSPIVTDVVRIEHGDRSEYVLVVGVISSPGIGTVAGLDAEALTANDPYYTDTDNWTGEVILSKSAATHLDVDTNDTVTVGGTDGFTVVNVGESRAPGSATFPIALVQLSELQALTGGGEHDLADQFVVGTNAPTVKDDLEQVYPQSAVLTRAEMTASETMGSDLPLALSVAALVVAIGVGTLFVVATMGLELVAERRQLATLAALGISTGSQLRLITVQTLITTALGGLLGGVGGLVAAALVNELALTLLTSAPIAYLHPFLVGYGLLVALVIGIVSVPFLLVLTHRLSRGVP